MMIGQAGSSGRVKCISLAYLTYPGTTVLTGTVSSMAEARPALGLPVVVSYLTTPTTRLSVWPLGAEAMLYLLGLMILS